MRPLRSRQQLEPVRIQAADSGQVNRAERREPAAQQVGERLIEHGEHRDAQERLTIQRPGPSGPQRVTAELFGRIATAPDDQSRRRWRALGSQLRTLLDPITRHAPMLRLRLHPAATQRVPPYCPITVFGHLARVADLRARTSPINARRTSSEWMFCAAGAVGMRQGGPG